MYRPTRKLLLNTVNQFTLIYHSGFWIIIFSFWLLVVKLSLLTVAASWTSQPMGWLLNDFPSIVCISCLVCATYIFAVDVLQINVMCSDLKITLVLSWDNNQSQCWIVAFWLSSRFFLGLSLYFQNIACFLVWWLFTAVVLNVLVTADNLPRLNSSGPPLAY